MSSLVTVSLPKLCAEPSQSEAPCSYTRMPRGHTRHPISDGTEQIEFEEKVKEVRTVFDISAQVTVSVQSRIKVEEMVEDYLV